MKVWEKIAQLSTDEYRKQTHCPAHFENKYNFIGNSRMKTFCKSGCSVNCLNEYFEMELRKGYRAVGEGLK